MGHSRPALPPASNLGQRPMNRSVGSGGRGLDRCVSKGWVRTDHTTPNSGLSLRPTLPSTQRARKGVNGAKRRKKAVIRWVEGNIPLASLPGFPSGDEGRNANRYMGWHGARGGGSRCWALPPLPWAFLLPSPFPFQAEAGGVHGFAGVGPNPWLCDPSPYSLLLASLPSSPPLPTRLQLWGRGQSAG